MNAEDRPVALSLAADRRQCQDGLVAGGYPAGA